MNTKVYYSHGKFLLTGEYVVLDGVNSLALPTQKGQYLSVTKIDNPKIIWRSYNESRNVWFEDVIQFSEISSGFMKPRNDISNTLLKILQTAKELNSHFLNTKQGFLVTTRLTFNRQFGLGSSSTLITNIAKWAKVNPYQLLWKAFGGSGYDVACANANSAITYQLSNTKKPSVNSVSFNPNFKDKLYFIYLNQKQNSKEAISHYRTLSTEEKIKASQQINEITEKVISSSSIQEFNELLNNHELIMSLLLQQRTCKELLFNDYNNGIIKSLGAWGGDFVLVSTTKNEDLNYFRQKGYSTIFNYKDIIL
ncbi:GYDIA family GHMP kinase [Pseudofulvibacter geojedonensis]|uniref:GYDIA family GHMP kinase n=1 Tax=Pseudofulvibacter geojedonensis TaxID=1123758 RepID=A0ABW3I3E4_9FLAO